MHRVSRAVSLLGDDELGDGALRLVLLVVIEVAVDEADVVGVLLDGARLAEVRELRALPLLAPGLDASIELTERDDRELQLLGERLQPSRDLADLLLARVDPVAPLHELEVVDDDEPHPAHELAGIVVLVVLRLQATHLGPKLEERERGAVVDPDRELREPSGRLRELAPVGGREVPGAQVPDVDPRLGAEHAVGELLARHFEREDRHSPPRLLPAVVRVVGRLVGRRHRHVDGDVEDEAGLPHAGACGDDREVPGVKPGGDAVVAGEAGGDAGDSPAARARLGERLEGRLDDLEQLLDARAPLDAGEVVDLLLGVVDELLGLAVVEVPLRGDPLARQDQLPDAPLLVDVPPVRRDVRHRRRGEQHLRDVRHPSYLREPLAIAQPRRDLHAVHRLPLLPELDAGLVDAPVRLRVEVLRLQELEHAVERRGIDHDGAEERLLRLEIVRRHAPLERGRNFHGLDPACPHLVHRSIP